MAFEQQNPQSSVKCYFPRWVYKDTTLDLFFIVAVQVALQKYRSTLRSTYYLAEQILDRLGRGGHAMANWPGKRGK